jgi:PAS domain S-box-containing protein
MGFKAMTLSMSSSLTLSESHFRRIVEMAPIGMTITALDGCILYVNQAFCTMLGYTKSELEKLSFQDLTYFDDLTANFTQRQMLLAGEIQSYQLEKRYLRKDGQIVWGLLTSSIERDSFGVPTDFVAQVENITERKRAEALVRASEERLRLTLEATSDGLWDFDLRSGMAYLSPHYYAITGYRPEEVTPSFEFFKRTVHPDDLPRVLEIMEAHMQGKTQSSEIEYRMVTPSGEIKWILGRGRVVERDAAGAPLRMLGTIKNITDRKNVERKLRESQLLLDGIVEHIPVMVFVKRASDLTFEFFNRAGEKLLGYSRNDLLGKSDYDLRPEKQGDWFTAANRKALASHEVTHIPEEPIQTASGETRYLQTWKISLRDENDEPAHLLGISLDVTEHKKEEETHTRLMEHLDASPDFVGFADAANAHIMYINRAGRAMTGIAGDEDVTRLKIADVHPAWANEMLAEVAMPAAAYAGFWNGECAFQHRDGHEIPVSMVLVAHKSDDGTVSA